MNNRKQTKRALLTSIMALVMCVVMLVGTTFAWFTDTASTSVNTIKAGNLNVQIQNKAGTEINKLEWIKEDGTVIANQDDILWEPGCTYLLTPFKIVNTGNLALKYKIEITGLDGSAKLLKVIKFTYKTEDGNTFDMSAEGHLAANGGATGMIAISAHMDELAGNEYQSETLDGVKFTVYATQDTVEYDSNGNTYDKDAAYSTVVTKTPSELETYGSNGQKRFVFDAPALASNDKVAVVSGSIDTGANTIRDINDTTVPGIKVNVPETVETLIFTDMEFNGALRGLTTRVNDTAQFEDGGILKTVKFVNCTFNGVWYGGIADMALNVEFANCKFTNQTIADRYSLFISYSTKWQGYQNDQRSLTFTGCEFKSLRGIQITNPDGVNVKFVGNTFEMKDADSVYAICLNSEGSNGKNLFGDVEIYGNTLTTGKQLVTLYKGSISMKDNAKLYLDGNTTGNSSLIGAKNGSAITVPSADIVLGKKS